MDSRTVCFLMVLAGGGFSAVGVLAAGLPSRSEKTGNRVPEFVIAREARVDEAGVVKPVEALATTIEIIGSAPNSGGVSQCPDASMLDVVAAQKLVFDVATEERFFPEFVVSVARIESRFNASALSAKGAYGLMQLEPATAARYRVNICDPTGNVRGGVKFLRDLHAKYRNPLYILAAYNAGERAMIDARGVPAFPETVRFVADVLNDFYEWPAVAAVAAPKVVRAPSSVAHPRTTSAFSARAPAREAKTPPDPSWASGFVMHVGSGTGE